VSLALCAVKFTLSVHFLYICKYSNLKFVIIHLKHFQCTDQHTRKGEVSSNTKTLRKTVTFYQLTLGSYNINWAWISVWSRNLIHVFQMLKLLIRVPPSRLEPLVRAANVQWSNEWSICGLNFKSFASSVCRTLFKLFWHLLFTIADSWTFGKPYKLLSFFRILRDILFFSP